MTLTQLGAEEGEEVPAAARERGAPGLLAAPGWCLGCNRPEHRVRGELARDSQSGPGEDAGVMRSILK